MPLLLLIREQSAGRCERRLRRRRLSKHAVGDAQITDRRRAISPALYLPCTGRHWSIIGIPQNVRLEQQSRSECSKAVAQKSYTKTNAGRSSRFHREQSWIPFSPLGFDPVNGPWDVDNDGDGVADSIWVDLGFPVRAAKDGKLYKPLFAILCLDMDGRLNLNAHGDLTQTRCGLLSTGRHSARSARHYPDNYFANHTSCRPIAGEVSGPPISISIILYIVELIQILPLIRWSHTLSTTSCRQRHIRGALRIGWRARGFGNAVFLRYRVASVTIDHSQLAYNDYLSANKWFEFDGLYSNSSTKQPPTSMQTSASQSIFQGQ